MVFDTKRLAKAYLHSRQFKVDVLSLLPTDLLYFVSDFFTHRPLGRMNRLLRLPRLSEFVDRTETRSSFPNAFRVFCVVCYIVIIIHWNACAYFAISQWLGLGSDEWVYGELNVQSRSNDTYDHSIW